MKRTIANIAVVLFLTALAACGTADWREKPDGQESPGSSTPAADSRPIVVTLGDSLTAGYGVDPAESYPAKIQKMIDDAGLKYRVINAGVSGDTSGQGLNRLAAVRRLKPAVVIVALGGNDGLRGMPVETTRRNLDRIIAELLKDGTEVVLCGMRMPPNYGPQYTALFHGMYSDLARKHKIRLVPFLLEGVGGIARLNLSDGIHPTAEGYDIVAANVWGILRPVLK